MKIDDFVIPEHMRAITDRQIVEFLSEKGFIKILVEVHFELPGVVSITTDREVSLEDREYLESRRGILTKFIFKVAPVQHVASGIFQVGSRLRLSWGEVCTVETVNFSCGEPSSVTVKYKDGSQAKLPPEDLVGALVLPDHLILKS